MWSLGSDFRAFVFCAFANWSLWVFQVEQELKRFIHRVLNVNNHNDGRTRKRSSILEQDALALLNLKLKSKAQPSPLKEEFMYTPQKEVDPDELPEIESPKGVHFDDGNTPQAVPFQSLGEEEIQQHDPMALLSSDDEAIEALGSVIDQLVGFTTSLAQHNHGEVGKAFEYLSQHHRVLERLRLKIRRLVDYQENTQEYMGGDNVLHMYVLPTLKKC